MKPGDLVSVCNHGAAHVDYVLTFCDTLMCGGTVFWHMQCSLALLRCGALVHLA